MGLCVVEAMGLTRTPTLVDPNNLKTTSKNFKFTALVEQDGKEYDFVKDAEKSKVLSTTLVIPGRGRVQVSFFDDAINQGRGLGKGMVYVFTGGMPTIKSEYSMGTTEVDIIFRIVDGESTGFCFINEECFCIICMFDLR